MRDSGLGMRRPVLSKVRGDGELFGFPAVKSPAQRSAVPDRVSDVEPRASLDQQADDIVVTRERGLMERCRVTVIPVGIVTVRVLSASKASGPSAAARSPMAISASASGRRRVAARRPNGGFTVETRAPHEPALRRCRDSQRPTPSSAAIHCSEPRLRSLQNRVAVRPAVPADRRMRLDTSMLIVAYCPPASLSTSAPALSKVLVISTAFDGVFCRWPSTPLAAT